MTNPYIELLKKCDDTYTNLGEYYIFTDDDKKNVTEIEDYNESTDDVYDMLKEIAKNKFPNEIYFQSVGSEVRGEKVKLPLPLGSMNELKFGELKDWIIESTDYVVDDKLDGISCLNYYENGVLKESFTRGDGYNGCIITNKVKLFKNSVSLLKNNFSGYIRGEIIIPKNDEEKVINELEKECGKRYKNIRNLCAGILNKKSISNVFSKYAHFVSYYIDKWDGTTFNMFEKLKELGLETPEYKLYKWDEITDESMIENFRNARENGKYEYDGIIITMNKTDNKHLGFETSSLNPKNSRKYKVGRMDNYQKTIVEDIEWNISKDAIFKPRVKVKPIDIQGVTINWVTGHNYKTIVDNGIGIGSEVLICRRGSVIPHIENVIEPVFDENSFNLPECVRIDENGVELELDYSECPDTEIIDEVEIQKIIYFCSKLGVDFAGEGNIRRIMNEYIEEDGIEQLIETDIETYQEEIGVNGIKFYGSLHKKLKDVDICDFMDAVGAFGRGIGSKKLQKVIDKYNTLDVTYEQLMETEGFAEISSQQYIDNLIYYHQWMEYMDNIGYPIKIKEKKVVSNECANVNICFTGVRDKDLEDIIKEKGGKICSSITKVCNVLVAKDPNSGSSKLKKAIDNGVEIISLEEAWDRYGK